MAMASLQLARSPLSVWVPYYEIEESRQAFAE